MGLGGEIFLFEMWLGPSLCNKAWPMSLLFIHQASTTFSLASAQLVHMLENDCFGFFYEM
jgi:hypothetical protein